MTPNCLAKMDGIISKKNYDVLKKALDEGDQKTWDITMQDSHADVQMKKASAIKNAQVMNGILEYLTKQKGKGVSASSALSDYVSGSGSRQNSEIISADRWVESIRTEFAADLVDMIHATRPVLMGMRRASNMDFINGLVKGIFGDADAKIPKAGQAMIDSWHQVTKKVLLRAQKAGMDITELEGFYIPTNHYTPHIAKAGKEAWMRDAKNLFNIRLPKNSNDIAPEELLSKIYDNITSEGTTTFSMDDIAKGQSGVGTSHKHFRYLQPKNGKAWLDYNTKYGRHSNPIDAMKEYIDGMATEIGVAERFGTNPRKMMDDISAMIRDKEGGRAGGMAKAAFDQVYSRNPYTDDWFSSINRGFRAIETATKLPLAPITALTDTAFTAVRSMFNGMNPIKVFSRQIKNLALKGDYKTAARLGLFTDYAIKKAVAAGRYTDSLGYGALDRVADFSTRVSGLNHWTNSGKAVFGLEMMANFADASYKSFDSLPKSMRRTLDRYGLNKLDWDVMKTAQYEKGGTKFLDPMSEKLAPELRTKIIGMVREETSFAVPEPNAKTRAIAVLGTTPNTMANEFLKTASQFKTFGVSVMVSNMGIAFDKSLSVGTRLAYMTGLITSATTIGTLVLQLKDVAKGREPRELTPKLAMEGLIQGGLLGPVGDVFFRDPNLFGGTPAYALGPTVSDLVNIHKVMYGSYKDAMETGEKWETKLKNAAVSGAEQMAFPLRLWYTRVAMERLMLDQIKRTTDPDYYSKLQRKKEWLLEENGQGFWSEPKL